MSGVRGQELLMEPSIEITYDPTIKVHGITEELFKQQPEGKFVLKPFTIISKKVYKNFTDRSHAFNYLLKFLKKKSKEDNNVILRVFSEPGKTEKTLSISNFSYFLLKYTGFYRLLKSYDFIYSIKRILEIEDAIDSILIDKDKEIFKTFEYLSKFTLLLSFTAIFLILSRLILVNESIFPFSQLFSILNTVFLMIFAIYTAAIVSLSIYFENIQPVIGNFFKVYFKIRKLLYKIEKSKQQNKGKNIFIVNLDVCHFFNSLTTLNFIKYLLSSIENNKNITIIFHLQKSELIYSVKEELTTNQFDMVNLLFENDKLTEDIEITEIDEFEENFPIKYEHYQYQLTKDKLEHENQQLEHENKEQLARLIQSAKLESMNITTSGVSHEMRNPLSIIQLVIENLRMEKNLTKEVLLEDLDKIQTQISRIYKLTETFQKFSAQKNLTKKSIDTQITNSLYFFEQRLLSNKIEVNYDKPEESIGAIEFSEELSIVIENLISNAIDALKGNPDAKIGIRINLANDKLEIKFSDNGHGIPQESIKEIFTPLYTTKGPGQGTGLGLWLCYTIVKDNLKGDIRVDSPPNEGTTFTILLPIDGDKDV